MLNIINSFFVLNVQKNNYLCNDFIKANNIRGFYF